MLFPAFNVCFFALAFCLLWRSWRGRAGRNAVREWAFHWRHLNVSRVHTFAAHSPNFITGGTTRPRLSRRPVFSLHLRFVSLAAIRQDVCSNQDGQPDFEWST